MPNVMLVVVTWREGLQHRGATWRASCRQNSISAWQLQINLKTFPGTKWTMLNIVDLHAGDSFFSVYVH